MAIVLVTCPIPSMPKPKASRRLCKVERVPSSTGIRVSCRIRFVAEGIKRSRKEHSRKARPCATLYALPFEVRRKADTVAAEGLYAAVT